MATTKTLLNKVLRGLRQFSLIVGDSANEVSDEYRLLIMQLLNEAKEEVEENGWPFYALRQTVTITLTAGTAEYDITTSGAADVDTNDRSLLLYEKTSSEGSRESAENTYDSLPQVFDVTTSSERRLREKTQEQIERLHFTDSDEQRKPELFAIWIDGDSLRLKVWPTPDGTYTLKTRLYIPQDELSSDDLTTVLSIPDRPVWTLALFKANEERGEELGRPGSSLQKAHMDALANAVGREQTEADITVFLER